MINKNILIFLNTDYHVETALSIYQSVKLLNHNPYILLDFSIDAGDFGLEDFLNTYNIKYLTKETFDNMDVKNFFNKMIVVTAGQNMPNLQNPELMPPINYNNRMRLLNDRAILIYHRADYSDYKNNINRYFINPECISVTQFSQRFGLNYINQVENPIEKLEQKKYLELKDELNLVLAGRFNLANRNLELIKEFKNIDNKINKKININFLGQQPYKSFWVMEYLNSQNFKNIQYEFNFNLNQIDFYKKIINSDYFLNLISNKYYFSERFTSNVHHIISFSKPNLSPIIISDLVYNYPSISYTTTSNFVEKFVEMVNIENEEYEKIVNNFSVLKNTLRNHNNFTLNKLFN